MGQFLGADYIVAKELVESIKLIHVMAGSETNLFLTKMAVLKLSNGDLVKLKELTIAAKVDFRDVIMWASK